MSIEDFVISDYTTIKITFECEGHKDEKCLVFKNDRYLHYLKNVIGENEIKSIIKSLQKVTRHKRRKQKEE